MNKTFILYFIKEQQFGQIENNKVLDIIYNNIAIVPSSNIIKNSKNKKNKLYKFTEKNKKDNTIEQLKYTLINANALD